MKTQVVVIGAGPGGYAAAFRAADFGLQATLVDPQPNPGGVCTYVGCIPSKALLHVGKVIGEAKHASAWGVTYGEPTIDVAKLRTFKNSVVQKLTGGLGQLVKHRKVTYVQGLASFVDGGTIRVELTRGGAETISFDHAILATGSRPAAVPGLSIDSPRVMDSTAALDLPDIPASLLVVGGGYIGLEMGSVYAALGTRVTVVEMTDGLLPGADRDLVTILARRMEQTLHRVRLSTRVTGMTDTGSGVRVTFAGDAVTDADREQTFDRVLVSVGRKPNSAIGGLDRTGVVVGDRGFIQVDQQRRTAAHNIFAIGDVVGEPMLAHKASHEAGVAVDAVMGKKTAFEPQAIPAVVFTDPEVAWCGLTEAEAARHGRKVDVARFPWAALGRALAIDRPDGVTKLVIDPATERVLGVGVAGAGAGELIAEGVLAVEMGALAADVALSIHAHPTLSETLMEAAEVFFGHSTHVYRPRKK